MRRLPWLARLAVLIWLSWLALVGLMLGMLRWKVWHPHYLPMMTALAIVLVAGLTLLVAASWRLIRGPRRAQAVACLLVGLAPLEFLTGHLMYGFGVGYGRQLDLDLPLRALIPFGESLLDLVARFRYPQRTEGERVVMISVAVPEADARRQVEAMDRHVRSLESRLGRIGKHKIYWVRGPLLGFEGKAMHSLCFGSRPRELPTDSEGLTTLDRHEIAHVVIGQFGSLDAMPPALLGEGWAEANSGIDPKAQLLRAWSEREQGRALSLKELLGPDWFGRHETPAYVQGPILVEYLLRKYGPERFVTLYAGCHQATIEEDCRRILGVSIDQLDQAYWAEIEASMGPDGYPRLWLSSLKLGLKVDPADWERFVSDYCSVAARIQTAYQHVQLSAERSHTSTDNQGKATNFVWHSEFKRSGPLRYLKCRWKDREELYLANPDHSFRAERKTTNDPWKIVEDPKLSRDQLYRRTCGQIDQIAPTTWASIPLFGLSDVAKTLMNPLILRVSKLERYRENDQRVIRLELEDDMQGESIYGKVMLQLSADNFSVLREETRKKKEGIWRGDATYDLRDGVPFLKSTQSEGRWTDGDLGKVVLNINDRSFGPIPQTEFTPERAFAGAQVQYVAAPHEVSPVSPLLSWCPLPLILGLVSFVTGACPYPWVSREKVCELSPST